jgi:hypothetical protein
MSGEAATCCCGFVSLDMLYDGIYFPCFKETQDA